LEKLKDKEDFDKNTTDL